MNSAKRFLSFFTSLAIGSQVLSAAPDIGEDIYITDQWTLERAPSVSATGESISTASFDDAEWIEATVPGTALTSYLNNDLIPDPNYADNQLKIDDDYYTVGYWYRNTFEVPESYADKKVWLNFDGINWRAEVFVNGQKVGNIDGAFTRGKFDITDIADIGGTNHMAIFLRKHEHTKEATVQTLGDSGKNGGPMGKDTPTFAASEGWDWMPTIRGRNIGIWNDVYLSTTGVVTLADPFVVSDLPLPATDSADLSVTTWVENHSDSPITANLGGLIQPGAIKFAQTVSLEANEGRWVTVAASAHPSLKVENPELWWPNGYGDPALYDLDLRVTLDAGVSDSEQVRFGIREYSYDTSDDILKISVNGHQIHARGGSWGMDESMLRCNTQEDYDIRVKFHKDLNFNMIRNWVGQTGDQGLYNACDKYGIMIFDDFWLANPHDGPTPGDTEMFLANAVDKVKRRRSHPSVVLWVGRNEGTPPKELDLALKEICAKWDGTRHYESNSAGGNLSGFGPYSVQNPDWYFTREGKGKTLGGGRLHSECGMPNIPSIESIREFMPEDKLWPQNDVWGLHDYCAGFAVFADKWDKALEKNYGEPTGIEDFVQKSQLLGLNRHKALFESYRRRSDQNGLIMWMSQSAWPSFVWQTYDFYFDTPAAYYGIKKACEPLHILWNCATNTVDVSNLTRQDYSGLTAEFTLYDQSGQQVQQLEESIDSQPGTTVTAITLPDIGIHGETHFIKLKLSSAKGDLLSESFYCIGAYGSLNMQDLTEMDSVALTGSFETRTEGNQTIVTATVTNPADSGQVALATRLKLTQSKSGKRVLPAYFTDNYFALLPGETKAVEIEFETKYLNGERPQLDVEGWNVKDAILENGN